MTVKPLNKNKPYKIITLDWLSAPTKFQLGTGEGDTISFIKLTQNIDLHLDAPQNDAIPIDSLTYPQMVVIRGILFSDVWFTSTAGTGTLKIMVTKETKNTGGLSAGGGASG